MAEPALKAIVTPEADYLSSQERQKKEMGRAIKSSALPCPTCKKTCYITDGGKEFVEAQRARGENVEYICFDCASAEYRKDPKKFFEGMEEKYIKLLTTLFTIDAKRKEALRNGNANADGEGEKKNPPEACGE